MDEEIPKPIEVVKRSKRYIYGRYFLAAFGISILVLAGSYTVFAFVTKDSVLPKVTVAGKSIGGQSKFSVSKTLETLAKTKSDEKVVLVDGDDRTAVSFNDIGLSLDQPKTLQSSVEAGRYKKIYPTFQYFYESIKGPFKIKASLSWDQEKSKKLDEILNGKKKDPQSPKISLNDDNLEVTEGQDGSIIDGKSVKQSLEGCFVDGCYSTLKLKKTTIKPDFTAADVEPFKGKINEIVQKKMVLTSDAKNIALTHENLLNLIDLERTVLEQKIVFNDNQIADLLKDKASKLNTKGRARVISAVDNSIITEGREAVEVDVDKSIANLKEALLNGKESSELIVSTVPIKEELQQPGYNLGKYSGKYIEVNLSEQTLYLINGGSLEGTFSVSTGKWSMPTPEGEYAINNKDPRAYSSRYELYMPYWMAFIGSEYGIHELPEWPNGTKEGEAHLGTPVSHGCIRLGRGSAEQVYNWTDIGTTVFIHK